MRYLKPVIIFFTVTILVAVALYLTYRDKTQPPRFTIEAFEEQTLQDAIQNIADATIEGGAPGVIIHVYQNGVNHSVASGVANKKTEQPMAADMPLRIASVSKIYTAVVIHQLIAEGVLDLDMLIKDLLPADLIDGVSNTDQATIRQLLHHTSGIPDYYDIQSYLFFDWRKPITLKRMLPVSRRHAATNKPGERYSYSNMGYLYLGEIAERVSGKSMASLIAQIITTPLELEATYYDKFQVSENDIHGYGTYLRPWKDTHEYWEHSGPDGGVMASASDVSQFLNALLLDGGSLNRLGTSIVGEMIERAPRRRQGLGIETIISRSGGEIFGHTGDVFGYQTIAYVVPSRDVSFVAQINCNCSALTSSLIANLYRAIEVIDGPVER